MFSIFYSSCFLTVIVVIAAVINCSMFLLILEKKTQITKNIKISEEKRTTDEEIPYSLNCIFSHSFFFWWGVSQATGYLMKSILGCPHGVMVKALDCRIVVCEFKLQLHYYIHFQTNTLGKGINLLILPSMG